MQSQRKEHGSTRSSVVYKLLDPGLSFSARFARSDPDPLNPVRHVRSSAVRGATRTIPSSTTRGGPKKKKSGSTGSYDWHWVPGRPARE